MTDDSMSERDALTMREEKRRKWSSSPGQEEEEKIQEKVVDGRLRPVQEVQSARR